MVEPYFDLAACAEMIFLDLPFAERVRRIDELGFLVEIWNWPEKDIAALKATGARFSSMSGYVTGRLADNEGAEELLRTATETIEVAHELGVPRLCIHGTGLGEGGIPILQTDVVTGAMWLKAHETLARLGELGEKEGVTFILENLNLPVDHPGTPFSHPQDTRALVRSVNSPGLRMNLDLYHAQIGSGNLIETVRESLPWIGEVQIADVPGRCEPGTGEINYRNVAKAMYEMGYRGVVAMEAYASGDSEVALQRFRDAFSR
jgi:hydroxypyruvate isomerase